jgi:hypothetical protein
MKVRTNFKEVERFTGFTYLDVTTKGQILGVWTGRYKKLKVRFTIE